MVSLQRWLGCERKRPDALKVLFVRGKDLLPMATWAGLTQREESAKLEMRNSKSKIVDLIEHVYPSGLKKGLVDTIHGWDIWDIWMLRY